jgi:hypothetical protein
MMALTTRNTMPPAHQCKVIFAVETGKNAPRDADIVYPMEKGDRRGDRPFFGSIIPSSRVRRTT